MIRQLTHQTVLAVYLVVKDDTGGLTLSITFITSFFVFLWRLGQIATSVKRELAMLNNDVKAAIAFTSKVLQIGFFSLTYGLGVTL